MSCSLHPFFSFHVGIPIGSDELSSTTSRLEPSSSRNFHLSSGFHVMLQSVIVPLFGSAMLLPIMLLPWYCYSQVVLMRNYKNSNAIVADAVK